jgi:hypothetical protein
MSTCNYEITALLKTPIIATDFSLSLDSLLAAAVHQENGSIKHDALAQVPIKRSIRQLNGADFVLYHASCVFFTAPVIFTEETFVRSRRLSEMGPEFYDGEKIRNTKNNKGKPKDTLNFDFSQKNGDWKSLLNVYRVVTAPALVWFVETDNPERIVELLSSMGFIGKRRGQGFGELGLITYRAIDHAATHDANGLPLRPIPEEIWRTACLASESSPTGMSDNYTTYCANPPMGSCANYTPSAWEAEAMLCAMPASPTIDLSHENAAAPIFQFLE